MTYTDIPPKRQARTRVLLVRFLIHLISLVAFEEKPKVTNIPGHYTREEFDILNAIWKQNVYKDIQAGKL